MRYDSRVFASLILFACGCSFKVQGLVGGGGDGSSCAAQCVASPPGVIGCDGGAPESCAFFCGGEDGGTAHCLQLVPSDVVQTADLTRPGVKPVVLAGDATFHSDTGAVTGALTRPAGVGLDSASGIYFETRAQAAPYPTVGVFVLAGFTVRPGQTLHLSGSNAIAVVATQDSLVEGTIELQGDCLTRAGGPGGGAGGDPNGSGDGGGPGGGRPGGLGVNNSRGGGGGGTHGDQGGRGGNGGDASAAGGQPGSAFADVQVGVLAGGGGGGAGTGAGGGGGGALHLVVGGQFTVRGAFQAGGCGGRAGGATGSGGGGGAGGMLIIEAATILLQTGSVLASNGGGGGSGDATTAGAAGTLDGSPAPGGGAGRRGGSGGAGSIAAGSPGMAGIASPRNGGGGGGAAGRIALRTASGRLEPGSSTVLSPVPVGGPDSPATISAVRTR